MRGSSSPRGRMSLSVPSAFRLPTRRMAFAMRDSCPRHAPDSLRIGSDCSWLPRLRLKIEINVRESFAILDLTRWPIPVDSWWYSEGADIATFALDRLLATEMRARYQCRRGRNLFALAMEFASRPSDARRIVDMFGQHMDREAGPLTRTISERPILILPGKPWKGDRDMSMRRAQVSGRSRSSAFDAAVTD